MPSLIVGVIFLLAIVGMYVGWRIRSRNQAGMAVLDPVPQEIGEVVSEESGLYVATTLFHEPLERVTVRGLGFRSRMHLTLAREGILLALTGHEPGFIPRSRIRSVQRATWAIDKAVETGGLVVIAWQLGEGDVDSYFRLDGDPEEFVARAHSIMGEIE